MATTKPKKRVVPPRKRAAESKPAPRKRAAAAPKPGDGSEGRTTPRKRQPTWKATATRSTTKVAPKTERTAPVRTRVTDPFGYEVGSDSSLIAHALVAGGDSRVDVNQKAIDAITKANGIETRGGGTKNVPSLVSAIRKRLVDSGYTEESSYRLIPPQDVADELKKQETARKRAATREANKAASTSSSDSKAPAKRPARKAPQRKK